MTLDGVAVDPSKLTVPPPIVTDCPTRSVVWLLLRPVICAVMEVSSDVWLTDC